MSVKMKAVRLLKKGNILRAIFSRATVIILLLALQFWLLAAVYGWFSQYQVHFQLVEVLFIIGSIIYLVNSRMDSTSKITWLILIMLSPLFGSVFLVYSQTDLGFRLLKRRLAEVVTRTGGYLVQDEAVLTDLKYQQSSAYNLVTYFQRHENKFPAYAHTAVTYFPSGEEKFAAMKEQLLKAERFIFLEYFIIGEGEMWGEILAILEQKAREGVEVRVLYDGMNELSTLSFDYAERLEQLGIQARAFAPLTPFISTYYNYRDHRKILVIDGKVAFNGGVNLADEYINLIDRFGHWKDTALMLEGPAVDSFTVLFLQMWTSMGTDEELGSYLGLASKQEEARGLVIPYGDSPLDHDRMGKNVYIDLLNQAERYVYIMTPYLILDSELEHAIKFAAERGVSVKIIMPGIPDKKVPFALAKTYYPSLMDSGVEIYEYTPGFNHAKVFVADDIRAVVGTINLDYRSLSHHFECATYLYQVDAIGAIRCDVEQTLTVCHQVTSADLENLPLMTKLTGLCAKIIAPLL